MQNEIKTYFLFSFFIHLAIIVFIAIKFSQPSYITLPIEVKFYSPQISKASSIESKPKKIINLKKKDSETIKVKKEKETNVKEIKEVIASGPKEELKNTVVSSTVQESIEGSNISLDTKNFPYTYYTNTIVKKIAQNWSWSNKFGKLKALIYFKIASDGSVRDLLIKKPSGDDIFDQQASRSIILASPFPPLPSGYKEEDLGVFFEFSYTD